MSLQEDLIAKWILEEAASEQIVSRGNGGYVFNGENNQYLVEVKVFKIESEVRGYN